MTKSLGIKKKKRSLLRKPTTRVLRYGQANTVLICWQDNTWLPTTKPRSSCESFLSCTGFPCTSAWSSRLVTTVEHISSRPWNTSTRFARELQKRQTAFFKKLWHLRTLYHLVTSSDLRIWLTRGKTNTRRAKNSWSHLQTRTARSAVWTTTALSGGHGKNQTKLWWIWGTFGDNRSWQSRTAIPLQTRTQIDEATDIKHRMRQKTKSHFDKSAKTLKRIAVGTSVRIYNVKTNQWDTTGSVVNIGQCGRSYQIKTQNGVFIFRNRRFIREFQTRKKTSWTF